MNSFRGAWLLVAALCCLAGVARAGDEPRRPATVLIKKVTVVGNSVFPVRVLDRVTARYEGRRLLPRRLREIAHEVEELYHQHGYLLARAFLPEQEIVEGHLVVHVIEGHYGLVHVEGNEHYSSVFIRRMFWPARRTDVVRMPELERALLILNDLPDLCVTSVFRAGAEVGTADVILKVRDERPLHLDLEADNFGSKLVGQNRVTAGVTAGNVLTEGDRVILRATQAVDGKSSPFLTFDYGQPIDHHGRRVSFGYSNAQTKVGDTLSALDIRGRADILSLTVYAPLARTVRVASNASVGFVAKAVENTIFGGMPTSSDELRNLVASYDEAWTDPSGRTLLSVVGTQGLGEGLGGTPNGSATASRAGSGSKFTKLTADAARLVRMTPSDQVLLRAAGQVATRPMAVPEQWSIGGADSVRGYAQSEFLGDHGYFVSAEYRRSLYEGERLVVQGIGFVDHGFASLENPGPNEIVRKHLTGFGLGARVTYGRDTALRLDVAAPLDPTVNANGEKSTFYVQLATRL